MSAPEPLSNEIRTRSAYTLLELMLALALLGALMTIAWSLMGTFRDAEQRGWKLAHRTQTIRAARAWLQSDVQHLLRDEATQSNSASSGNSLGSSNSAGSRSRLVGNSLGFTASIAPSLDPLPFLEQLMSDSQSLGNDVSEEPVVSLYSDHDAIATEATQTRWTPETMEVEYELVPIESAADSAASVSLLSAELIDVQFSLTRRERLAANATAAFGNGIQARGGSSGIGGMPATANLADRVLTAQDLYRQTDDTVQPSGAVTRESRLDGLTNVQFKYFDGQSWQSEWNSDTAGGLPQAIALGFDFPARSQMKPTEVKQTLPNAAGASLGDSSDLLASRPSDSTLSAAEIALAAEPVAESAMQGDMGLMQAGTHEIQIVVYIGRAPFTSNQQSFGSQARMRVGGAE